jgi:hypothetical protein
MHVSVWTDDGGEMHGQGEGGRCLDFDMPYRRGGEANVSEFETRFPYPHDEKLGGWRGWSSSTLYPGECINLAAVLEGVPF